jgi:hypothetical protein
VITTPPSLCANYYVGRKAMNRKKKLNDTYNKKLKKMNDKLRVSNKPKYVSKADREKIAVTENESQS